MTDIKHIIEPERMGLWVASTFILALLALAVALIGIQRNKEVAYISQAEVLMLNKKIEALNKGQTPPAASTQVTPEEKK
ncbi:MFS transporter [Novimethylophilus kurashikiensis]|uniref:MFS transporter n=1 Tax=Novimethylophilus kurashikiensis TaxID=1825523 RepID=A0A2R5F906_9PROT|nr:hypothetical protein [Novimethylophilus kurashikiensis]GBG13161.1 MFS transporter [Novimethylophilus kurashikiensis]